MIAVSRLELKVVMVLGEVGGVAVLESDGPGGLHANISVGTQSLVPRGGGVVRQPLLDGCDSDRA